MNSTMPKSGQAPTSPNAMPGGLGAILQQPGAAPTGASSRSIASIMDTARTMSDMQLADVLSGKSLDVPQYVAMTEAMGRKSLRTAMQGAQAQQQLHQPSVKDRLMAEEAQASQMAQAPHGGIDQLPAPNMGSVDMAGGGIVAFANRGAVEEEDPSVFPQPSGFDKKLWNSIKEKFSELNQPWGKTVDASPAEVRGAMTGKNLVPGAGSTATTPTIDSTPSQAEINAIRATNVPTGGVQFDPTAGGTYKPGSGAEPKKSGIAAVLDKENGGESPAQQDYLAKLAGVGEKTRAGIAGLKNEAQSQILLDAMSALMGSRNLAEAGGKAGTLFAGRVGAMGKESRALEKEANDYDLNLAKYREAVESGDKDRALKLKELMETSKYHQAMIGKPDAGIAMLNALKNPENMEIYKNMMSLKTPKDVISKDKALAEWGDMLPAQKRAYGNDFNAFYNSVSSSTMGGGTGSLQAQAEAIKKSRGL